MLNPILIAVPLFLVGILIEFYISYKKGLTLYRLNDTITNLHLGTGQILCAIFIKAPLLVLYTLIWTHTEFLHPITWQQSSVFHWGLGILIMDCAYYFFHRYSHEFNFLWAAHAVHHQSEEYNLSVALRQSWIQQLYSGIFYLPLAVLGIPIGMFFLLNATNTLYQFWIHTRLCDRIGIWESFLNTPSHHRVHHGVDDEYVDKNYAGVLIIWDKLFGTFTSEKQAPRYGVIKPLRSWNPLWANLDVWAMMWRRMTSSHLTKWEKLLLPFRSPAWLGKTEDQPAIQLRTDLNYQIYNQSNMWSIYVMLSGGVMIQSATWWVIGYGSSQTIIYLMPWITIHLLSGVSLSGLLENKSWAIPAEYMRLVCLPILAYCMPLSAYHTNLYFTEVAFFTVLPILSMMYLIYQSKKLSTTFNKFM